MLEDSPPPRRKWPLIIGGLAAGVALIAGGGALGWAMLNDAVEASNTRPVTGEPMQVALYTPEAPAVQAGDVMDVGALADGYEHRERPPSEQVYDVDADWSLADEDEIESNAPLRRPRWVASSRDAYAPDDETVKPYRPESETPETRAQVRRLVSDPPRRPDFGFDEDQPDYAEQRLLRRERTESRWRPVPNTQQPGQVWRPVPGGPPPPPPGTYASPNG